MKKLMVFAVAAILVFAFSASSHAWTVFVDNRSNGPVKIEVEGEHLFWRQIDCTTNIDPRKKGRCDLPGAICPSAAYVTFFNGNKSLLCGGAANCSNVIIVIDGFDGTCSNGTAPW
jgi:hypothetical protein